MEPLSLQFFLMFFQKFTWSLFVIEIFIGKELPILTFFFMIFEDKLYFIISPGIALEIPSIIVFGALTTRQLKNYLGIYNLIYYLKSSISKLK